MKRAMSFSGTIFICMTLLLAVTAIMPPPPVLAGPPPIRIGSRLELFVDGAIIDRLTGGARLELHHPVPRGSVLAFDKPWEGPFCGYVTVLDDDGLYRMYYRGLPVAGQDGSHNEVTCYAESSDGVIWTKPDLGLFEVMGTRRNNVILAGTAPFSHNFSPFIDTRPGVPEDERYKALAGTVHSGLHAFASSDGVRWRKLFDGPIMTEGAFDSQNVAFWSEHERCYVCCFRTWTGGGFKGIRTVSRSTSPDFRTWSAPEQMDFGDTPPEHLYTNQTLPYFRARHIYIAVPMRFMPGRQVLTAEQAKKLGVDPGYRGDCAEAVLMSSRGGAVFDRTFMEGFIRPGTDPGNWASRAGLTALGILPTAPAELSLYKQAHYAQPSLNLVRYTLRTDGFVSVNAPFDGGGFETLPLVFSGSELVLNISTSAAGHIRAAIVDGDGIPIPGYSIEDADDIVGDDIARTVSWNGSTDVSRLSGRPVRLVFEMKDADIYSLKFGSP